MASKGVSCSPGVRRPAPLLLLLLVQLAATQNADCPHECIPLTDCPKLLQLLENKTLSRIRALQDATCSVANKTPKVCCPEPATSNTTSSATTTPRTTRWKLSTTPTTPKPTTPRATPRWRLSTTPTTPKPTTPRATPRWRLSTTPTTPKPTTPRATPRWRLSTTPTTPKPTTPRATPRWRLSTTPTTPKPTTPRATPRWRLSTTPTTSKPTTPRATPRWRLSTTPTTSKPTTPRATPRWRLSTTPTTSKPTTPRTTPRWKVTTPRTTPRWKVTTPRTTPRWKVTTPRTTPRWKVTTPRTTPRWKVTTPRTTPRWKVTTPRTTPRWKVTTPSTTPKGKVTTPSTTPRGKVTTPSTPSSGGSPEPSSSPLTSLLPQRCGQGPELDRIHGGTEAPLDGYPWMAVFGYLNKKTGKLLFQCGGSVINERYVLTAAHCVDPSALKVFPLKVIRLGEWDLSTEVDCEDTLIGFKYCAPPAQEFTYEDIIIHSKYDTRTNYSDDIALVRLDRPVDFSGRSVQPVCLPPQNMDIREMIGEREAVVAGWGFTEKGPGSDRLLNVFLPMFDKKTCNDTRRGILVNEQVCFGGRKGEDSCRGDSGGPLMVSGKNGPPFLQIGVVSYGAVLCGSSGVPGVYTSVAYYRNWVEQNLKP
ncbi:uncharacterized protein [Panulirus ornatus]|uniref:uncharacterized protein n=1 Tax=Panulirus ornatus TaxID=150431 RepID=UPI003A84304A